MTCTSYIFWGLIEPCWKFTRVPSTLSYNWYSLYCRPEAMHHAQRLDVRPGPACLASSNLSSLLRSPSHSLTFFLPSCVINGCSFLRQSGGRCDLARIFSHGHWMWIWVIISWFPSCLISMICTGQCRACTFYGPLDCVSVISGFVALPEARRQSRNLRHLSFNGIFRLRAWSFHIVSFSRPEWP